MKLIEHLREGKDPRWEFASEGESVFVTTRQLLSHSLFIDAALRQCLNSGHPSQGARAFASLTKPMSREEWRKVVNDALAKVQKVND
jgi:hypothetical protein